MNTLFLTIILIYFNGFTQEFQIDYGIHPPEYSAVGRSGWQFLKLPTHARFAAMGGIISALAHGDASATLGNPASIVDVKDFDAAFTIMNWIADIKLQSGAVVKNFGRWGSFGLNVVYVDYGEMIRTENREALDDFGQSLGYTEPITEGLGTFTGGDFALGINYALRVTDRLQIGSNIRYVEEKLDDAKTSNWTIDIGTMYYTGIKTFRIAMLGRNFGPDAEFTKYDERIGIPAVQVPMPMVFVLGGAIDLFEGRNGNPHLWTVAAEFTHPNDGPEKVHLGTEYTYNNFVSLRAGYRFFYDEEGLTFGGGLRISTSTFGASINYAYIDFGRLNNVQLFSINFHM